MTIVIETARFEHLLNTVDELKNDIKVLKSKSIYDNWLDIEQACNVLKCSKRTLQDYRDKGYISFTQIASKIYFSNDDINEFMQKYKFKAFKKK